MTSWVRIITAKSCQRRNDTNATTVSRILGSWAIHFGCYSARLAFNRRFQIILETTSRASTSRDAYHGNGFIPVGRAIATVPETSGRTDHMLRSFAVFHKYDTRRHQSPKWK